MQTAEFNEQQMDTDTLRQICAGSIQQWARELAIRLSPSDAWRLLLSGALMVMAAVHTKHEMAAIFRGMASEIEQGALAPETLN